MEKRIQPARQENSSPSDIRVEYFFAGPLPHPDNLIKYEKAYPGAAKEIIGMAKQQAQHRQSLEYDVVHANIANEKRSMILSFVLTVLFMGVGAVLIFFNKDLPLAFLSLFGPAIFQAGSFLYVKKSTRQEIQEKEEQPEIARDQVSH